MAERGELQSRWRALPCLLPGCGEERPASRCCTRAASSRTTTQHLEWEASKQTQGMHISRYYFYALKLFVQACQTAWQESNQRAHVQ